MKLLMENWRRFVNEEAEILAEAYQDFLAADQSIFQPGVAYEDYVKQLADKVEGDRNSTWLFNHHASELAWEEGKADKAKGHIALAVKSNPYGNSITGVLDFIMNKRGSFEDLEKYIQDNVEDPTEKQTAHELLNNEKFGQSLK